jgi:hypothetical protein
MFDVPRTPVTNVARQERLAMRATAAEKKLVDDLRGAVSISDFLRRLVHEEASRRAARRS